MRKPSVLLLLGCDGGGVGLLPIVGVVGVALCTIEIGVHLIAHHEAHEVLLYVDRVGVAIESFHEAAAFLVRVVVDGDGGQAVGCLVVENLFEGCEGEEGCVGVFT